MKILTFALFGISLLSGCSGTPHFDMKGGAPKSASRVHSPATSDISKKDHIGLKKAVNVLKLSLSQLEQSINAEMQKSNKDMSFQYNESLVRATANVNLEAGTLFVTYDNATMANDTDVLESLKLLNTNTNTTINNTLSNGDFKIALSMLQSQVVKLHKTCNVGLSRIDNYQNHFYKN